MTEKLAGAEKGPKWGLFMRLISGEKRGKLLRNV